MDPDGARRPAPPYAGGPAAYLGEASSSSSPRPRPPPPPQGHAIQPLPLSHLARVDASPSAVYGYVSPSWSLRPPPQQQGHGIHPVWPLGQPSPPWGLGAGAPPSGFGPPVPWPIPPLHPQFGSQQHAYNLPLGPTVWGPSSNTSQYLDAMVAQQRSALPTWPQQPQFAQHPPTIYHDWKLVQIRSDLQRHPMMLEHMVMSTDREYSSIMVHRLDMRDEEMHQRVLDGFKHCRDVIMGNRQGHAVFKALLRSIHTIVENGRQCEELQIIVEAAVTPELIARSRDGVTSLIWLITAVAWNPDLSTTLVNCFVRDRVMDNFGGDELIAHCFTTMDYDVTKALVRHAIDTINGKMNSSFGVACLGTCFRYARGEEAPLFQDAIVERAVPMAMGRNSTRLVQSLLDRDMDRLEFRRRLLSRLMQHVVRLSNDWNGTFVVRHCFTSEERELRPIVLTACADLPQGDVQALANHFLPLNRVLLGGNTDYPREARRLALKIQALPAHIREHSEMKVVMSAVRRVLADNLVYLGD